MTPEEFAKRMKALWEPDDDLEEIHIKADALMGEVLRSLGYGEGVEIFDKAEKWYA